MGRDFVETQHDASLPILNRYFGVLVFGGIRCAAAAGFRGRAFGFANPVMSILVIFTGS